MWTRASVEWAGLFVWALACAPAAPTPPTGSAASDRSPTRAVARTTTTARAPAPAASLPFRSLDVVHSAGLPARVVMSPGARDLPLVVALHGSHDRAEWLCDSYARTFSGRATLLCPRGVPRDDWPGHERYAFDGVARTEREVWAAIEALPAEARAAAGRKPTLFGFSIGAAMALFLFNRSPERYDSLVLIEGADDALYPAWRRWFRAQRSHRLLLACGRPACAARVRAGLGDLGDREWVRFADGSGSGHSYLGPVARSVEAEVDWLLAPIGRPPAPVPH